MLQLFSADPQNLCLSGMNSVLRCFIPDSLCPDKVPVEDVGGAVTISKLLKTRRRAGFAEVLMAVAGPGGRGNRILFYLPGQEKVDRFRIREFFLICWPISAVWKIIVAKIAHFSRAGILG